MPYYVQRDFNGQIVGLYSLPQPQPDGTCLTEPKPLPEDHPEVILFLSRTGKSPKVSEMLLRQVEISNQEEYARLNREIEGLRLQLIRHHTAWSDLELALSALLYTMLGGGNTRIPYAVYYSLTGFDARKNVVNNVMLQLIDEAKNKELDVLREPWEKIDKKINQAKDKRNSIAHGTITILQYMQKGRLERHALLAPIAFDVIRINRRIQDGGRPGINLNELESSVVRLMCLMQVLDSVNKVIEGYRQAGKETFTQTLPSLEESLKLIVNPSKYGLGQEKP